MPIRPLVKQRSAPISHLIYCSSISSRLIVWILLVCALATISVRASSTDDLRAEIARLRKDIQTRNSEKAIVGVDNALSRRIEHQAVATRATRMRISGLIQVWYQSIANDNHGLIYRPAAGDFSEANDGNDNDTFRIRRVELTFDVQIHDSIRAVVSIDPARQHAPSFYPLPTLPVHNRVSGFDGRLGPVFNDFSDLQPAQQSSALNTIPRLLQDAYIQFESAVPHHDFRIGQFLPPAGEEAWRRNGDLDFMERSMGAFQDHIRDMGIMIHGSWWDDRFQYWGGVFNGPDGSVLSDADIIPGGNRSDDNDAKNIAWRVMLRPVWRSEHWQGRLELGYARTDGWTGESGQAYDSSVSVNGSNIKRTAINKQSAWAYYRPGGPVRGWWMRGEWNSQRGRHSAFFGRTNLLGIGADGSTADDGTVIVNGQLIPAPVTVSGWNVSTGFKIADSVFAENLRKGGTVARALERMEFVARYESYENINMEGLVDSDRTVDQFKTRVTTAGINYNLRGANARIQANYFWVKEPDDHHPDRGLREVRNDAFAVNFQIGF